MTNEQLEVFWQSSNYAFEIWRDPPGQEWEDFSHETDELLHVLEGELEIEIEGETQLVTAHEDVFIPAHAIHSIRNIGDRTALWLYGYRTHS